MQCDRPTPFMRVLNNLLSLNVAGLVNMMG